MRRILPPLGIIAAGVLLSVIVFVTLRSLETENARASFDGVAQERLDALETNVTLTLNNLVSIGALFDASPDVKRDQFDRFTVPLLARNRAIQALEWIPRVPNGSRMVYEQSARRDGFRSFQFKDRTSQDKMARADEREEYFPVFFVAPFAGNEKALGFDLASDPVRRAALQGAADSGQMVATSRVKLVQEVSDQYGFLVFRPVYRGGVEAPTTEGRRETLIGMALAVFRVADIVEKAGPAANSASALNLAILDLSASPGEKLLYPKGVHLDEVGDLPQGFRVTRTISVAGRNWELVAYPLSNTFHPARWSSWAAFVCGLVLTSLMAVYVINRKRAEDALYQSEERARLLFATIPHPAYVFDLATLAFLELNDTTVQKYGYSREEFLRMRATDIHPDEEAKRTMEYLARVSSNKGTAGVWKHRIKDGRIIDVEIHFGLLKYDGHNACLAIAQDVTERNLLEIELRHAQKLEAVGRLAAGVAHEINTPIQFVGDNIRFLLDAFADLTQILKTYRRSDPPAHCAAEACLCGNATEDAKPGDYDYLVEEIPKAIRQSLDGVARVATLVRAMKVFAHPDPKEKAAADINEALLSTVTVARNEWKYVANVETEFGDLPTVCCNIGEVNQVFLNLLVNASHAIGDVVKATDQKGLIRVRTSREKDGVLISIADTGRGIPEDIRGKIFDPFFTTKESGRGTGQGLAIAHSVVVEGHGGTITFTTEVGKGTTFYVRLPLSQEVRPGMENPS